MPASKRPASISTKGPPYKKREVAKGSAATAATSSSKRSHGAPPPKARRKLGVTASQSQREGDSSDEEDADDEFPLDVGEDEEGGDDTMEADGEDSKPPKDPNAARESHKLQKETHRQRQASKPHATLLAEAKKHWSSARQRNISRADREKHVKLLLDAVRGKIQDLVFKHDASRVVQTIIKYGGSQERQDIAQELKGRYRDLAQSKYAKFLVTKLLRYCPSYRSQILSEFHGEVLRLLLHREASPIIADAYELYANAHERARLLMDLFGKEVVLFQPFSGGEGSTSSSATAVKPGTNVSVLKGVIEGGDKEKRKRIMSALKDNLIQIFNNPDKGAISHNIVHRALWEYLQEISNEDEAEAEKKRREVFESCQELVAEMVHTKEGSRAVREFLAYGNAKDRKQIIKTLKPHCERMCKDEEAQLVLFTALDVIDDTKLVAKSIISEILTHARTLAYDGGSHKASSTSDSTQNNGRRVLYYLLVPRSLRHFPPATVLLLAETDEAKRKTSKKDDDVREKEIRVAASGPAENGFGSTGLLKMIENKERLDEMCRDPGASVLVGEIMLYAEGDRTSSIQALISLLSKTYPTPVPSNGELMHLLDIPHASRLVKTLVQGGHFDKKTSSVSLSASWASSSSSTSPRVMFIKSFIADIDKEDMLRMAKSNGAFVIAELISAATALGELKSERETLKSYFTNSVGQDIIKARPKGMDVLLARIKDL